MSVKIAILIVGEYRSFAKCRKTMFFLDQDLDKDIYISTWNVTNTINPLSHNHPNFNTYSPLIREVTKEEIVNDIGLPATIATHDFIKNGIPPIINGWNLGIDLVKKSNIHYDYLLMFRPDTYFNNNLEGQNWLNSTILVDNLDIYRSSIGVRNPSFGHRNLDDQLYFSTFENMEMILGNRFRSYFDEHGQTEHWHNLLYNYIVKNLKLKIKPPPLGTLQYCIAREPMSDTDTFDIVDARWWKWFHENTV